VVLGFGEPGRAAQHAQRLGKRLDEMGVAHDVISSAHDRAAIVAAAGRGAVPVVRIQGADEDQRVVELASMLSGLQTHKLIFLRSEGGLRMHGMPLSVANLGDELTGLLQSTDIHEADKRLLSSCKRIVLELVSHELLVTLTSPIGLVHELFTVKGAGTLLRRGARIVRHDGLSGVALDKLRALLTSSFDKPPRDGVLDRPFAHVYVEENYRGAALLMQAPLGAYLSKFAVTRQAQGEGVGRDLWQAMTADHPVLFWRARPQNPIRSWYEKQCEGRMRAVGADGGEWVVFWRGVAPEQVPDVLRYVVGQPIDF
jgi:bifunctional N-acetylglutamate synthase/kinase